jgi:hypothetical protein
LGSVSGSRRLETVGKISVLTTLFSSFITGLPSVLRSLFSGHTY